MSGYFMMIIPDGPVLSSRRVTIKPGDHRFSGITYKRAKALSPKEDGAVEGLLSILPARVKRSFGRALGNLWWKIIN
ncbi:MAG TPA: hypothetical protein VFX43_20160 [Chitinophagaceae bacterium]|nr:hypothetical protein [Chitinophagaceae bacterium]